MAFNDYDDDGYADMFVANDGMEQFLWHNNGDGTFTNRALEAGVALSDDGKAYSGMGVDFADYDNDGRPDIVVTDLARKYTRSIRTRATECSATPVCLPVWAAESSAVRAGASAGAISTTTDGRTCLWRRATSWIILNS